MPELGVDIKTTSIIQPQSSCPFKSARQKIFGLGYSLLVFVYKKEDNQQTKKCKWHYKVGIMKKRELGDFQTPTVLADLLVNVIKEKNISLDVIVEPTCGKGSILFSAHKSFFPKKTLGIEIQKSYTDELNRNIAHNISILNKDFFVSLPDIKEFVSENENILFIGNPPWVTNSVLSTLGSSNLPDKNNFEKIRGIEAITGKSNFDISEYIIKLLIDNFHYKKSIFAFLCKISVAKKIMNRLWKNKFKYKSAEIYPIDSKNIFPLQSMPVFFI